MNANDIQTLHDKYCAFTGIPMADSKLFYIEYTGMGNLFEGAYNKGIKVKDSSLHIDMETCGLLLCMKTDSNRGSFQKTLLRATAPSLFVHGTATLTL